MPRPVRSAAVRRSVEDDENAQDVTDILNEEAENATRTSSRKRTRTSFSLELTSSPAKKRVQLEEQPASAAKPAPIATDPNRRQSGRLQTRKSLIAATPVDRRNVFEVPEEEESEEPMRAPVEPVKKLRALKKQAKDTASPFKALGVLSTITNALVNFDESPRKRGRPPKAGNNLAKIKASLQKTHNSAAGAEPLEEGDVLEIADKTQSSLQELGDPVVAAAPTKGTRLSKTTARRARGHSGKFVAAGEVASSPPVTRQRAQSTRQEGSPDAESDQSRRPSVQNGNPLAIAAIRTEAETDAVKARKAIRDRTRQTRSREPEPRVSASKSNPGEDDSTEAAVANDDVPKADGLDAEDEDVTAGSPRIEGTRPMTDAQRKAVELAAEEEEAKRQQLTAKALFGIETAVQLHGCEKDWTGALLAAAEIVQDRSSKDLESIEGRACEREFRKMIKIYIKLADESESPKLQKTERDTLERLVKRCEHLGSWTAPKNGRSNRDRRKIVRDIYEHLIPRSLKLAKCVLKARFRGDELSRQGMKEICEMLQIAYYLTEVARTWRPRPELGSGVKSKTQSDIKPRVDSLLKQYEGVIHESGKTKYIDDLAARAAECNARLDAQRREREDSIRANLLKYRHPRTSSWDPTSRGKQSLSSSRFEVVDIDDIPLDDRSASRPRQSYQHLPVQGSGRPEKRRVQREPTEDIPAPSEPPVSAEDMKNLILALRRFRNPESRWEDIVDAYGGPGGCFEQYDMDQVMAKSKWVKQTMASRLDMEFKSNHSWDFLRSVPG